MADNCFDFCRAQPGTVVRVGVFRLPARLCSNSNTARSESGNTASQTSRPGNPYLRTQPPPDTKHPVLLTCTQCPMGYSYRLFSTSTFDTFRSDPRAWCGRRRTREFFPFPPFLPPSLTVSLGCSKRALGDVPTRSHALTHSLTNPVVAEKQPAKCSTTHPLTNSLARSLAHSLTRSHTPAPLTHLLTYACTHSLAYALTHALTHSLARSLTQSISLTHSLTHARTHSRTTHSPTRSLAHSLTRLLPK
jgi:hypothetical protein